jgi:glycine/sarcosine N-methyltransferase
MEEGSVSTYFLTAETERGRRAIEEVMAHSYEEDIDLVPPEWALARIVDDVPVSFAMVAPNERLSFTNGAIRHGFLRDIATREDRRYEGHFRATMQEVFDRLRLAQIPLVTTHGEHQLYRRFGFDVFTHHQGIFITPEQIARHLGRACSQEGEQFLEIEEGPPRVEDLLLVRSVTASTAAEARGALLAAAATAERLGRRQILFEHPAVGVFSRHPSLAGQASLDSPFRSLALACGAEVRVEGGVPEGRPIQDGDWIKVLDAVAFVEQAIRLLAPGATSLPRATISITCDAGDLTITSSPEGVAVSAGRSEGVPVLQWPSAMLAQLFAGYQSAETLACLHGVTLPPEADALFTALLPRQWRVTRQESWAYPGARGGAESRLLSVSEYYARLSECMQQTGVSWDEREEPGWRERIAEEAETLAAIMGQAEERSVLDCSCGTGGQAIPLAELGWTVTATDVSESNLNLAWKRATQRGVQFSCYLCDMRHLDTHFRQPFDWVISCGGALTEIETDEGIAQALQQILGVLRPGGKCYLEMANMDFTLDEDRPRYTFGGEFRIPHGRMICLHDAEYESDTHFIEKTIFLTEDERCGKRYDDYGRWHTEVLSYRRRALRKTEFERLLQAAGFEEITFLPRDPWQSRQVIATKPRDNTAQTAEPTFTVRPFAMKEWRDVWRVHLANLADQGVFLDHTEIAEGPDPNASEEHGEWDIEFPEKVYLRGAGNYWLAWDGDLPIGSVGGQDIGGVIELRRMFVRADYRRRGVGTALVRALIEHSRAHGVRAIELWTGPDGPGRWLYRALGFRQTEGLGPEFSLDNPTPHRYMPAPGDGQIRMRLDLQGETDALS